VQHGSLLSFLRKLKPSLYSDHCTLLDITLQVSPYDRIYNSTCIYSYDPGTGTLERTRFCALLFISITFYKLYLRRYTVL
jgi:hypothetical protein